LAFPVTLWRRLHRLVGRPRSLERTSGMEENEGEHTTQAEGTDTSSADLSA